MKYSGRNHIWLILGLILGLLTILFTVEASVAKNSAETTAPTNTDIYLPVTVKHYPWVTTYGAQVRNLTDPGITSLAQESGLNWVRIDAFNWSKIEPQNTNSSGYNWNVVDEVTLKAASENGMNVIAVIRGTPDWAQKVPPYICGPVSETALPDFAEFVSDVVKRYSIPPYNIKHWELGNEPDIVYSPELGFDSVFGCWGDASQAYYGGLYYGEMLNVVYPAVKSADPDAKVLIGGLLQDCDPTFDKECKSGKFFKGIIRTGINERGDNFDYVNFHGYAPYAGPDSGLFFDEHNPKWEHRGGVVLGKLNYLRSVMSIFGLNKPIFHTEAALLCPEYNSTDCTNPDSRFYESQADYVVWLYVRNWANGVDATIWYEFQGPGWRYGGLLDGSQNPKPAYYALKFLTQELNSATYSGRVLENTNVSGYEFSTNDKKIWVLWSPDEKPHTVTLPATANKAFDKYGVGITLTGNQITVDSPVYVEFPH